MTSAEEYAPYLQDSLVAAVQGQHVSAIQQLLHCGANPLLPGTGGVSPITAAVVLRDADAIEALLLNEPKTFTGWLQVQTKKVKALKSFGTKYSRRWCVVVPLHKLTHSPDSLKDSLNENSHSHSSSTTTQLRESPVAADNASAKPQGPFKQEKASFVGLRWYMFHEQRDRRGRLRLRAMVQSEPAHAITAEVDRGTDGRNGADNYMGVVRLNDIYHVSGRLYSAEALADNTLLREHAHARVQHSADRQTDRRAEVLLSQVSAKPTSFIIAGDNLYSKELDSLWPLATTMDFMGPEQVTFRVAALDAAAGTDVLQDFIHAVNSRDVPLQGHGRRPLTNFSSLEVHTSPSEGSLTSNHSITRALSTGAWKLRKSLHKPWRRNSSEMHETDEEDFRSAHSTTFLPPTTQTPSGAPAGPPNGSAEGPLGALFGSLSMSAPSSPAANHPMTSAFANGTWPEPHDGSTDASTETGKVSQNMACSVIGRLLHPVKTVLSGSTPAWQQRALNDSKDSISDVQEMQDKLCASQVVGLSAKGPVAGSLKGPRELPADAASGGCWGLKK